LGLCLQGTITFDRSFLKFLNYYGETPRREVWGKCHVASPDQMVNHDKYRFIHMLFSSGFSSELKRATGHNKAREPETPPAPSLNDAIKV